MSERNLVWASSLTLCVCLCTCTRVVVDRAQSSVLQLAFAPGAPWPGWDGGQKPPGAVVGALLCKVLCRHGVNAAFSVRALDMPPALRWAVEDGMGALAAQTLALAASPKGCPSSQLFGQGCCRVRDKKCRRSSTLQNCGRSRKSV